MSGYIKIHRALFDHPIVGFSVPAPRAEKGKRPVPPFMAWEWLCAMAAFKEHRTQDNRGNVTEICRGQVLAGRAYLADQWGWSEQNVRTFLKKLHDNGMVKINQATNRATTVITICNYDKFQSQSDIDNQLTNQALTKPSPSPNHTEEREEGKEGKEKKDASSAQAREDEFEKFIDRDLIEWVAAGMNPYAPENLEPAEAFLRGQAKHYPPSQIQFGLMAMRAKQAGGQRFNQFVSAMGGFIRNARQIEKPSSQAGSRPGYIGDLKIDPRLTEPFEPADDPLFAEMREVSHAH